MNKTVAAKGEYITLNLFRELLHIVIPTARPTVFCREELRGYIREQISKGNLVRIKNRSINASEVPALIADHYSKDASINSIPDSSEKSNTPKALKMENLLSSECWGGKKAEEDGVPSMSGTGFLFELKLCYEFCGCFI